MPQVAYFAGLHYHWSLMTGSIPEIRVLADVTELNRAAAEEFVRSCDEAVNLRGLFAVALAGGATPKGLYSMLASPFDPFRARVRWSETHFFWGDERHVPPNDPDSNFRMVNETMLSRVDIPPANVHRIKTEIGNAAAVASDYEQSLREFFHFDSGELPRFDLVLLGMGADGHTASLFPDPVRTTGESGLVAACRSRKMKSDRITLTAPVLNNAASVIFLVSGSDKADAVRAVLQGDHQPDRYPAQLIRPTSGGLLWLLDRSAASLLKRLDLTNSLKA